MPRRVSDKIRVHIHLFEDDWEKLGIIFGNSLGRSEAVRQIVNTYVKKLSAQAERKSNPVELNPDDVANLLSGVSSVRDQPS